MDPDSTIVINNAPSLVTIQPAVARGVRQSMALRSTVADYWDRDCNRCRFLPGSRATS